MTRRVTTADDGAFCPVPPRALMVKRLASGKYRLTAVGLEMRCPRCGDYWPADTEFFYSRICEPCGLFQWCKACYMEHTSRGAAVQARRAAAV